jgi:tetratricopeptide (TPR) repeat protein
VGHRPQVRPRLQRYAQRHAPEVPAAAFDLDGWLVDVEAATGDGTPPDRGASDWERRCAALVAKWPLPMVQEVDPFGLRVFPSQRAMAYRGDAPWPPYAGRDLDERLRNAVRRYPFVLLEGPSRAGKSRTAFEALAHAMPRRRLIVPLNRHSLLEIDRLDPPIYRDEAAVVLLDDIERFLSADGIGLDTTLLDRWARAGVTVLATVRFRERERLEQTVGSEVLGVIAAARTFVLDYDLSPDERHNAMRLYPREQFPRGLAEHLAGADELRSVFDRGVEKNAAGYAVVRAAADRRRAGLIEAAPRAALRALFDVYYAVVRPIDRPSDDVFAEGMRWATEVVGDVTALLVESRQVPDAFEVSDVIVDHLDSPERVRPIPAAAWQELLSDAGPGDTLAVGQGAVVRDELDVARQAFESVMRECDDERGHLAALQLGVLLQRRGEPEGAEQAYRIAMRSTAAEVAPLAMTNLAMLLDSRGEEAEAVALLTTVLNGDFAGVFRTGAGMNLTRILAIGGDEAGATEAITATLRLGDPDSLRKMAVVVLPAIASLQGVETAHAVADAIRDGTGDIITPVAAAMVWGFAAQPDFRGDVISPEWLLPSSLPDPSRGMFEVRQGWGTSEVRPKETPELLRDLQDLAKFNLRAEVTYQLGQIDETAGETARAAEAYQQAWDEGLAKAALALAALKLAGGETSAAEEILTTVRTGPNRDLAAQALLQLGRLQQSSSRNEEAEASFRQAMATEHAWVAPSAAAALGRLLLQRGDYRGARTPLEYAAYSEHRPAAASALLGVGSLELFENDLEAAREALRKVTVIDDEYHGRVAALGIARLLTREPSLLEAIDRTQEFLNGKGDPAAAAGGATLVGYLLWRGGELEAAAVLLGWAARSGQPSAGSATLFLGRVAESWGDVDWAENLYRQAMAHDDEKVATGAAEALDRLLSKDPSDQAAPE